MFLFENPILTTCSGEALPQCLVGLKIDIECLIIGETGLEDLSKKAPAGSALFTLEFSEFDDEASKVW